MGNYNSEMRKKTTASVEAARDHVNEDAALQEKIYIVRKHTTNEPPCETERVKGL